MNHQDGQEIAWILRGLRPGTLLLNLWAARPAWERHFRDGRIHEEIGLARTGGMPSAAELQTLDVEASRIRQVCEADPAFRAAVKRLAEIGIPCEFGGQGDACGEFAVLRVRGSIATLPALERLAADEAGYLDEQGRADAADRFRIFMLRNYDHDWQANRQKYPDVGGSPYSEPESWPKSS